MSYGSYYVGVTPVTPLQPINKMDLVGSIDQSSVENLEKTVSFKLPKDEWGLLKEQSDKEGTTMSDLIRRSLRPGTAGDQVPESSLRRELQGQFDLERALDALRRTETELAQTKQELTLEKDKRKKLKKQVAESETALQKLKAELATALQELEAESEGGLGSLVTKNPAVGEMFSNLMVRLVESPTVQKTLGGLMGLAGVAPAPNEDEQALLKFWQELGQKLAPAELKGLFDICLFLGDNPSHVKAVLRGFQAVVIQRQSSVVSASTPAPLPAPSESPEVK